MIAKHKQQSSLLALIAPLEDSEASPNRIALQRLLQLRAFVTVIGLIGLAILLPFSSIEVPPSAIIGLLIGVAASLVIGFWRLRSAVSLLPLELLGHLLADVVLLILLLTQTGGISNPLISYLLVLLAVSAPILLHVLLADRPEFWPANVDGRRGSGDDLPASPCGNVGNICGERRLDYSLCHAYGRRHSSARDQPCPRPRRGAAQRTAHCYWHARGGDRARIGHTAVDYGRAARRTRFDSDGEFSRT